MSITIQGTVPYPQNADARPIIELATELADVASALGQTGGQLRSTAGATSGTWSGAAADAYRSRLNGRSETVDEVGELLSRTPAILQTFAAAIVSTQVAYNTAAAAEQAARAGMPWTAAALAAAIAAEGGAVAAHQAAGVACGSALGAIVMQIAAKEVFPERGGGGSTTSTGGTTEPTGSTGTTGADAWSQWGTDIWDWLIGADGDAAADQTAPSTGGTLPPLYVEAPATVTDTTTMPTFAPTATDDERFATYRDFFSANGVDVDDLADGERAILGLRVPTASTINGGVGAYDDRIVVVWTENGVRHVEEFAANTEPSAQYDATLGGTVIAGQRMGDRADQGADADFDGNRDLGRLPAGTYEFGWATNAPAPNRATTSGVTGAADGVLAPFAPLTLERDVNHDGNFDAADEAILATAARGSSPLETAALHARQQQALSDGNTIRFHPAGTTNTYSAGCQTFPGTAEWQRFRDDALGGLDAQQRFTYVLHEVDAADD